MKKGNPSALDLRYASKYAPERAEYEARLELRKNRTDRVPPLRGKKRVVS